MAQMLLTKRGGGGVQLTGHLIYDFISGGNAAAAIQLTNAGVAQALANSGNYSFAPEWLPSGTPASYEARWTDVSGSITVGTAGVWQNLGTSRSFGVTRIVVGATNCTGTLEIRDTATSTVQASATI